MRRRTVCAMSRRDRQRRRNRNRHGHGAGRVVFLGLGVVSRRWPSACSGSSAGSSASPTRRPSHRRAQAGRPRLRPRSSTPPTAPASASSSRTSCARRSVSTDIPQTMKDATVAIEDKRFCEHKGVDFEGIVRAGFKNVKSGKTVQGGSTLTMQLVREPLYRRRARATASRATSARSARRSSPRSSRTTRALEGLDPQQVPQQRPVRDHRRPGGARRPGRRARLLRQAGQRADPRPSRRCSPACPRRRRSTTRSSTPRPR